MKTVGINRCENDVVFSISSERPHSVMKHECSMDLWTRKTACEIKKDFINQSRKDTIEFVVIFGSLALIVVALVLMFTFGIVDASIITI